jgi:hypothetical protein
MSHSYIIDPHIHKVAKLCKRCSARGGAATTQSPDTRHNTPTEMSFRARLHQALDESARDEGAVVAVEDGPCGTWHVVSESTSFASSSSSSSHSFTKIYAPHGMASGVFDSVDAAVAAAARTAATRPTPSSPLPPLATVRAALLLQVAWRRQLQWRQESDLHHTHQVLVKSMAKLAWAPRSGLLSEAALRARANAHLAAHTRRRDKDTPLHKTCRMLRCSTTLPLLLHEVPMTTRQSIAFANGCTFLPGLTGAHLQLLPNRLNFNFAGTLFEQAKSPTATHGVFDAVDARGAHIGSIVLRRFRMRRGAAAPATCLVIESLATIADGQGHGTRIFECLKELVGAGGLLAAQCVECEFWEVRMDVTADARLVFLQLVWAFPDEFKYYPDTAPRALLVPS